MFLQTYEKNVAFAGKIFLKTRTVHLQNDFVDHR